jgi:hypothetical protein
MRRCLLVLFLVLAVLALPATAGAKEITAVSVCGADGCTRLTDRASLDAFMRAGGLAEEAPSAPQRSYVLRVRVDEPGTDYVDRWTSRWLPDAGLIASHEDNGGLLFTGVEPALERVLRRAVHGHTAWKPRRFVRRDPVARVDEVVEPPAPSHPRPQPATAGAGEGFGSPLAWAALGALALLGAAGAVRARRR